MDQIFSKVRLARSTVSGAKPSISFLDIGEIAINAADGKIYYKNSVTNEVEEFSGQPLNLEEVPNDSIEYAKLIVPSPLTITTNAIDWALPRTTYARNITANTVFSFSNIVPGKKISVIVKSNGNYSVTWPASVRWPHGQLPVQRPNGEILYEFVARTTSEIYGTSEIREASATELQEGTESGVRSLSPLALHQTIDFKLSQYSNQEDANFRIKGGTILQLKDVTTNGWRTIWFDNGNLQIGESEDDGGGGGLPSPL
jgi:hypothetical protein